MATKYLDSNGLLYLWGKIKSAFVSNVSYNSTTKNLVLTKNGTDSNIVTLITQEDIPEGALPSTTTPKMDGTATIGSETTFARGDHIHPTDTSRASSSHNHGNLKNAGTVETASGYLATIGSGDRLLVTDSSASNKLCATWITFDGSTTTKALSQKGTWVNVGETNVLEGVQVNGTDLTITNKKVNVPVFTGATTSADGTIGLVPAPTHASTASANARTVLSADGYWNEIALNATQISSPTNGTQLSLSVGGYTSSLMLPNADSTYGGAMSYADKAKLDSITMTNGVIDSSCLPSFVDDVIEAYARPNQTELGSTWLATGSASGTVITPETGKIYVLMNDSTTYSTNSQFRWGGTAYVKLNDGGVTAITNAEIDVIVAS